MTRHIPMNCIAAGAIELKDGDNVDPGATVLAALDALKGTVETRLAAAEAKAGDTAKVTARVDQIEARLNRPGAGHDTKAVSEEVKAFSAYLRHGDRSEEVKTLQVGVDPLGGYLAPPETSTEMIRNLVQFSPIRSIASVRQTGSPSVTYPKRTGITNGKWKGETQAAEGSERGFGQVEIPTRELNTFVDISNQLLADSAGLAEQEVRLALAEDFAAKEGLAFVSGDGVLAPQGFMTNAEVAYVANGHATNLSADALITLMYALPAVYRNAGTWVMNGSTLATVRKLKDGQNNYLWQPAFQAGQPETILGRPVVEAIDMPDAANGTFPIAFGDFSAGYRIVDRLAMSILVNPYLLATNGITRIHATRRVGSAVVQPGAMRRLKMATS